MWAGFVDEMEKISSMVMPGMPSMGSTSVSQISPMERKAMMGVYESAIQNERDPMRRRRLFEQARGQMGMYAMPLVQQIGRM